MTTSRDVRRDRRGRWPVRAVTVVGATLAVLAAVVPAALAHISVTPSTAETGSTTELTFRVPNEEANAATTQVSMLVPTEHPIAQVLAKPIPGWTISIKSTKLAHPLVTDDGTFHSVVSQVTWHGGRIEPGQYQDFSLSADPLPDQPTTLVFKTLQVYSNGDVERWIDVPTQGQPEPEHPAPALLVVAAASDPPASAPADGSATQMPGMTDNGGSSTSDSGSNGKGVAWVALGVSVVAALLAAAALVAARRRA
jgi:periplasmic copper chaperone A